jgi:hypothetical protein
MFKKIILSSILAIGILSSVAIAQTQQQYQVAYELDVTNQEIIYIEFMIPYITNFDLYQAQARLAYLYQKRDYLLQCLNTQVC